MIRKISEIFKDKGRTFSFEFFSPKTEQGVVKLYDAVSHLNELKPDFLSVTYGAGGSTRDNTTAIVEKMQGSFNLPVMHHLTCIGHTKDVLKSILDKIKKTGICNVLALRGDPPQGQAEWQKTPGGFEYSYQLCRFIRSLYGGYFCIGAAGFPECHRDCPDKDTDARYLKLKIDSGADFVITQLFFDNSRYFEYVKRIRALGVNARIIPGVLPIINYEGLVKFCAACGADIPQDIHNIFKPIKDDEQAVFEAGVEFAIRQCRGLLDGGAPGIHFFTLNKAEAASAILTKI